MIEVAVEQGATQVAPPVVGRPVQRGPIYVCWRCGHESPGLRYWEVHPEARRACGLDAFAAHIAYLRLPCLCHRAHGVNGRVAVLQGWITPLEFYAGDDYLDPAVFNVQQVVEALVFLRGQVAEAERLTAQDAYWGELTADDWALREAQEREYALEYAALMEDEK